MMPTHEVGRQTVTAAYHGCNLYHHHHMLDASTDRSFSLLLYLCKRVYILHGVFLGADHGLYHNGHHDDQLLYGFLGAWALRSKMEVWHRMVDT